VVEDWGNIGVDGERVYSILVPQVEGEEPILRSARESFLVPATEQDEVRSAQYR